MAEVTKEVPSCLPALPANRQWYRSPNTLIYGKFDPEAPDPVPQVNS